MHELGKAYRHRAIEVIKICRRFSAASEQRSRQDTALSSVLEQCDIAIDRAVKSRKKATQESDYHFEMAIRDLNEYDLKFHHSNGSVERIMEDARQRDMQNMNKSRNQARDHSLIAVEFHILPTLPSENPTVVRQWLSSSTGNPVVPEILWNFSHFEGEKRLTLAQNPHFYEDLPTSPGAYGGRFSSRPTERYEGTIYVLTNNSGRVFLEFGSRPRAFDNTWTTNDALVFRDVCGRIEGETIVGESIENMPGPPFWYRMEPTRTQPGVVGSTEDWRDVIRKLGGRLHTRICIGAAEHNVV